MWISIFLNIFINLLARQLIVNSYFHLFIFFWASFGFTGELIFYDVLLVACLIMPIDTLMHFEMK